MARCFLERRLIGEILVERGLVTAAQLEEALKAQRAATSSEFIGLILARLGYVEEIDVVTAFVLQCNLPFIAVSKHAIDPDVIRLIPGEMARKAKVIPLDRIGNVLSLVMQNPVDDVTREELERMIGCHIAIFISTRTEIERALEKFYPAH